MQDLASIVAPVATTLAALIVASNLGARLTGIGFIIFTVGSLAWCMLGFATGQDNLLWQNVLLTGLNLFGIWRWLGWQAKIEEGGASASEDSRARASESLFPVSLLGKAKVLSADGKALGNSVDAMAGCESGRIAYLVVSEGGVAGVGETLRRLPWKGCSAKDDNVRTRLPQAQFCALEPIEPDHWPAR